TAAWHELDQLLVGADLIVSTTGASEPIVTVDKYRSIEADRFQRPIFILDLAVPRDFDPAIAHCLGVPLYTGRCLGAACDHTRLERDRELPKALQIIEDETQRFMAELHHRATSPVIERLRQGWSSLRDQELKRLFRKLPDLGEQS